MKTKSSEILEVHNKIGMRLNKSFDLRLLWMSKMVVEWKKLAFVFRLCSILFSTFLFSQYQKLRYHDRIKAVEGLGTI